MPAALGMNQLVSIYFVKAIRVFVFGMVSIMTPVYLSILGFSPFYVGLTLAAVVSGNIISNIILTWYSSRLGVKPVILLFSALMFISGLIFFFGRSLPAFVFASLIGNISVTGTEAGPFQSVETAVIPNYVTEFRTGRAYGAYNVIGYVASSIGALASSLPSHFNNSIAAFRTLYLVYGCVGLMMLLIYMRLNLQGNKGKDRKEITFSSVRKEARTDVATLSALYFADALGGGFVTQSLLSYWFYVFYQTSLSSLGLVFLVANVISAISTFAAPFIAERIGNLRTMVYTHLLSNSFLAGIPLAGSFELSVALLFLRQSLSQMDVPTRQAFMVEIFNQQERVAANAVTNTSRSFANLFGAPVTGYLLSAGFVSLPIICGALIKILYDVAIYSVYRKRVR
ncbi:MAG: MFS transporter [Conexivisphaerales archaeon]